MLVQAPLTQLNPSQFPFNSSELEEIAKLASYRVCTKCTNSSVHDILLSPQIDADGYIVFDRWLGFVPLYINEEPLNSFPIYRMYYRNTSDLSTLDKVVSIITENNPNLSGYQPTLAVVVTWMLEAVSYWDVTIEQ